MEISKIMKNLLLGGYKLLLVLFIGGNSLNMQLFAQDHMVRDRGEAWQFGVHELSFHTSNREADPFYEISLEVSYILPS